MNLRTRLRAPLAVAVSLVALPLAFAPSSVAASTPVVKVSYVQFDSPGADRGGNTSLNGEYVRITNTTGTTRSLTGWTLRDRSNHVYTFPSFSLKARATVTVYTGKGTASSTRRYFNQTWYVWNNTNDTAYLRDSRGKSVHACAWTTSKTGTKTC